MADSGGQNLEKIPVGGRGKEPGRFLLHYCVAVSTDNEMFVNEVSNRRINVYSMSNGALIRIFATVVPGGNERIVPFSVAVGVDPQYLWVFGSSQYFYKGGERVIQYSRYGHPIKTFNVSVKNRHLFPNLAIAIDVRNNNIIVGDRDTIWVLDQNGHIYRSFKGLATTRERRDGIGGITLDKEGNILFTDLYESVKVYNYSGDKIFEFGTRGNGTGQLSKPAGLCLHNLGHIIVANYLNDRVDMFTRSGEFVRTVANVERPWGVAMGPGGQLVVTSRTTHKVFMFAREEVLP
ncbi:hypothetical protein Bbelb_083960 [Branchiostoma belcheri]|nr:hypothetical protein Bbelb_083960 [Branchiostoma belcheri]